MPEVITQDELIQRIEELEAFVSKVARWDFNASYETFKQFPDDISDEEINEARDEALALLEP